MSALREARNRVGLSQGGLATLTGLAEGTVREIEAGRRPLTLQTCVRVGDALQVDGAVLYARHALDEWSADLAMIDLDSLPTAVAKIRRALAHYAELEAIELPDELRQEARELGERTAKILAGISAALPR